MNLFLQLLKNRLDLIKIITIDIILYLLLIFISDKFQNIQIISYLIIWVFLSYLLGRYHLTIINYESFIKYFIKSLLIYLIIKLINNIFGINYSLFELFFLCSILLNVVYLLFNYKEYSKKNKWLTNDIRLINLYQNSIFSFKNNFIYLYDRKYKYQFSQYKGFIMSGEMKNFNQLKHELIQNKNFKTYTALNWCELYLEALPLDLIDDNDFYKRLNNYNSRNIYYPFKRIFEFICSLLLFVFSLPIIVFFSILILLQDGYPLFYSQIRTGINSQSIKIFKIRSMKINSENNGPQWSPNNDPRVTLIGKLIRKNRIDELPQLLSVLRGELSLIGPRPERPEIDKILEKEIKLYPKRYTVRPGITGWAQVNYPYGASIKDAKIKQSYDLFYVKNASFLLDFIIFIKTIKLVLNGKGANPNKIVY